MLKFIKKRTVYVAVSHWACDNSKHIDQNLFLIGDNNVFDFQTMILLHKYIVIDLKNCIFAFENNIFDCLDALLRFLRI